MNSIYTPGLPRFVPWRLESSSHSYLYLVFLSYTPFELLASVTTHSLGNYPNAPLMTAMASPRREDIGLCSLPNELLLQIFEMSPLKVKKRAKSMKGITALPSVGRWDPAVMWRKRRDFFANLCKVSRRFHLLASTFLYEDVRLDTRRKDEVASFVSALLSRPELARYCKSMQLVWDSPSLRSAENHFLRGGLVLPSGLINLKQVSIIHDGSLDPMQDGNDIRIGPGTNFFQFLMPIMSQIKDLSLEEAGPYRSWCYWGIAPYRWPADTWALVKNIPQLQHLHVAFGRLDSLPDLVPLRVCENRCGLIS